jgi:hypothetical protein
LWIISVVFLSAKSPFLITSDICQSVLGKRTWKVIRSSPSFCVNLDLTMPCRGKECYSASGTRNSDDTSETGNRGGRKDVDIGAIAGVQKEQVKEYEKLVFYLCKSFNIMLSLESVQSRRLP